MVGISYPGISQLYVARTQPPHLAAITPLSVIDDTYRGMLYPGGILNTGFAVPWANERTEQAAPYGQGWEQPRSTPATRPARPTRCCACRTPTCSQLITDNPFYRRRSATRSRRALFVDQINVPVFLAGAWQDEQTGGHFPAMLDDFTAAPHVYATLTNGSHTESLSPASSRRYAEFLDLYVGHRRPPTRRRARRAGPGRSRSPASTGSACRPGRLQRDVLRARRCRFEAQTPIRVLFEEGAADGPALRRPAPALREVLRLVADRRGQGHRVVPHADGGLRLRPSRLTPGQARQRSYRADPSALPRTTYSGVELRHLAGPPDVRLEADPEGTGLGWITPASDEGPSSRSAPGRWTCGCAASARDTDLEVTLSEVRPDGTEVYVQSGWLRASHRALDATASTTISPVHTDLEADAAPLPAGEFTQVRVELFPFAQPFRAGSRIRITVDAPGGARPLWAFDTIADGEQVDDRDGPSSTARGWCCRWWPASRCRPRRRRARSLRSQPCRTYRG